MATIRRIGILALAIAAASVAVVVAGATEVPPPDERVIVIARLAEPEEGFSDGGDAPDGFVAVLARPLLGDGFSDGGDGLIRVFLEPAGPVDEAGFIRVLALPARDGFSDGGDGPLAVVAQRADGRDDAAVVLLERAVDSPSPPEGGDS